MTDPTDEMLTDPFDFGMQAILESERLCDEHVRNAKTKLYEAGVNPRFGNGARVMGRIQLIAETEHAEVCRLAMIGPRKGVVA